MKVAHFYCYGGIGTEPGEISALMVSNFIASLDKSVEEIHVPIISNGGDLFQAYAIHDALRNSGKKIVTRAEGLVASSGTIVFASGDEREVTENSRLMFHLPFISDPEGDYRSEDLIDLGTQMKSEEQRVIEFYCKKTGLSSDVITPLVDKDTFISADDAIKLKFATKKSEPLKAVAYFNPIKNTQSKIEKQNMKLTDRIKAALKILSEGEENTIVATASTTEDGVTFYYEGMLIEGTKVFSDEAMTTAIADGTYMMDDGSTVIITGGSVASVSEKVVETASASVEDQLKAANEKIEILTAELQSKKAEHIKMSTEVNQAAETIGQLTSRLENYKSNYVPKTSGTQIKQKETPLSKEEREQALREAEAAAKKK